MKKEKKTDNTPSLRSIKLSQYRQNRVARQKEAFILRDDVFAFIGIFTSQPQISFCQKTNK